MNAYLVATILTIAAVLDYLWENFVKETKDPKRAAQFKTAVVISLLVIVWWQAGVQHYRDVQSDQDTDFLKNQLVLANESLTNTTLTIKGMNDGGDSYAEPTFGFSEGTNLLSVYLPVHGQYFLRSVSVTVLNETKRIEADIAHATNVPPSEKIVERFLGDLSPHWWNMPVSLCTIPLDPSITNHVRVDINAMNGFSWQIYDFSQVTNGWSVKLHWLYRRVGDKLEQEPPEWRGKIMVY
jgi:hypothetical protein